ncbi:MAG: hypothetical protein U5L96_09065 [Owenweeksia sp.]|nr:hypothetical protein [Owenweeksia sp.]
MQNSVTGCIDTFTLPYTVYPKPEAGFEPSVNDSCGPINVSFVNLSSPKQQGLNRGSMSFLLGFWQWPNFYRFGSYHCIH